MNGFLGMGQVSGFRVGCRLRLLYVVNGFRTRSLRKNKVNIYHQGTFAGTENYKTHGDPTWVEIQEDSPLA